MAFERKAHYSGRPSLDSFKVQFNQVMADDLRRVFYTFMNESSFSKVNEPILGYSVRVSREHEISLYRNIENF